MIYLDYSATTPLDKEVLNEMLPYFTEDFGNANSLHTYGRRAARAVSEARNKVAAAINAKPNEIYFTAGGTEADNWAILGTMRAYAKRGAHLIVSAIEHSAIMESAAYWKKSGGSVSYVPVDEDGIIKINELKQLITPKTVLISVMLANNEIGSIQPIKQVVSIAREHGIKVHTDAVQAVGSLKVDVNDLGVDMLSLSAHKFYGPKGAGALYIRTGTKPDRLINGGEQERKMRGGTINVPQVVGLGFAIERAVNGLDKNNAHLKKLRDHFVQRVRDEIPDVKYNGHPLNRLNQNANFSFEYVEGEAVLLRLDLAGVATSSGSACSSGSLEPSHVLLAIDLPVELAHGSIRFSFGKYTTMKETDETVDILKKIINELRELSPLTIIHDTGRIKV